MTAITPGVRIFFAVAIYAAVHGGDPRGTDHRHIGDVTVAVFARLPSCQVSSMTPKYEPWKRINADPGYCFFASGELPKLYDRASATCDRLMAGHTEFRIWNRHGLPGVGIAVTSGTIQALRGMELVTEGNWLYGIFAS